jgi:hypothetical protein
MTSNPLLDRVLRFIRHNFYAYQAHRTRGEYQLALERLERTRRLIALARDQGLRHDARIAASNYTEIDLLERHIDAMFDQDRAVRYERVLASL